MIPRIKALFKILIGWPLSALALYFIFKTFLPKSDDIVQNLQHINVLLLGIGIVCFFLYYLLRSILWHKILGAFGYSLLFQDSALLWASSEFKRYIPGNIWSFVGRTVLFGEKGVTKKDMAKAMFLEVQFTFLGCIIVSLLSIPFLTESIFPFLDEFTILFILTLIAVGLMTYVSLPHVIRTKNNKSLNKLIHLLPHFPERTILTFLVISTIALFFFGSGYYYTISSIVVLNPQLILLLTGFFVFSLLVGLLSFFTPTGLGVREGAITVGLSKIIPISIAGFASLFGRIVLITTEALFLISAYLFHKVHNKKLKTLQTTIRSHPHETVLAALIMVFIIFFSLISILRHDNFYTGRFDLGNMTQTVWNTKHGRIFELTNPNSTEIVSRLAFHADFILILLAPFYFLWEDPRMLLIIQAVVVGLGAIFVYLLAKDALRHKLLTLMLSASYLLNPALQRATIYDFHAVTLATTFLLGAFYFLTKKSYRWFLFFAVLAAITKEQIWAIIALFGIYIIVDNFISKLNYQIIKQDQKAIIFGLIVFFVSSIMFYVLIWHAIPAQLGDQHFALDYYQEFGDGPTGIVKNILFSPDKIIATLTTKARIEYFKQIFFPLGYLPFGAPLYLIFAGPDLAINVLSSNPQLHQIYYQYTAAITPFLYIAAIYSLKTLKNIKPSIPSTFLALYVILMAFFGAYRYGPLPWAKGANLDMVLFPRKDRDFITEELQKIPLDAKVAATNNIGAHLSHRPYIYTIPQGLDDADTFVFLLSENSNQANTDQLAIIEDLKNRPEIQVVTDRETFIILKKGE